MYLYSFEATLTVSLQFDQLIPVLYIFNTSVSNIYIFFLGGGGKKKKKWKSNKNDLTSLEKKLLLLYVHEVLSIPLLCGDFTMKTRQDFLDM